MCTKLAMDGSSHRLAAVGFQARARAIQNWRREWPVVGKQSTLLERVGARGRPGNGNGAAHGSAGSAQWHNAGHGKPAPDIPKSTTPPGAHHGRRTLPAVQASMYLSPQWNALAAHLAGQTDCSFLCTQGLVSSSRVRKLEDGDDASAVGGRLCFQLFFYFFPVFPLFWGGFLPFPPLSL